MQGVARDPMVDAVIAAPATPASPGSRSASRSAGEGSPTGTRSWKWRGGATVDLVVIGPEAPLVEGVADDLREAGFDVRALGPRGATRGDQSLRQADHGRGRRPDVVRPRLHEPRGGRGRARRVRRPHVVRTTASPPARASSSPEDRDAALAHADACLARPDGRLVIEEYLRAPRSRSSASATAPPSSRSPPQDFKCLARRRRRPQHRWHGRVFAARLGPRGVRRRHRHPDRPADDRHHASSRYAVRRRPLRRPRLDDARAAGRRVQRPLRRPRDPGRPRPPRHLLRRGPPRRRHRRTRPRRAPRAGGPRRP